MGRDADEVDFVTMTLYIQYEDSAACGVGLGLNSGLVDLTDTQSTSMRGGFILCCDMLNFSGAEHHHHNFFFD